jgi:6-phosphogluconate dehydrogenase
MGKEIGFIGLGRMGYGMSERLLRKGFKIVVYNRSQDKVRAIVKKGAKGAKDVEDLVSKLDSPRIVWLMLPAGKVTNEMINQLIDLLDKGDIIIDGANAFFKDAEKHGKLCAKKGIHFFDVGVSGGIHGLKKGYTLMIGGPKKQFSQIEEFCKALAPKGGYGYFGLAGSGHYTKAVHNIIEYIYLEGIAEGIEMLDKKNIDIEKALNIWAPASVIKSWILDLAVLALGRKDFGKIKGEIRGVTMKELKDTKKAVGGYLPAFDQAVKIRKDSLRRSRKLLLGKKMIAAIRREFGGHSIENGHNNKNS